MSLLPQLVLNAPKRSNFDLSYINRFTATPGALYPVCVQRCLPGDHFEISLRHLVKTFALKAPLMGKMRVKFDFFFVPDRLYVPAFRQNMMDASSFAKGGDVQFPYFNIELGGEHIANPGPGVAHSTLMDFLGIPPGFRDLHGAESTEASESGYGIHSIKFDARPLLGYYDIWRNYYRNPQESNAYIFGSNDGSVVHEGRIHQFPVAQLDEIFYAVSRGEKLNLTPNPADPNSFSRTELPDVVRAFIVGPMAYTEPLGGLMLRCYHPDYLTNFIATDVYNQLQLTGGGFVVSQNGFTVNQFRLANKLQKLAERAIIAGNRYGEFIRAMFGVNTDDKLDIPEFLGSYSEMLEFQDIVNTARPSDSTSESSDAFTALGASGGRGVNAGQSRKFYVNTTEYGNIFVMFSIVPLPDYYQGVKRELTKTFLSDEFNPQLDRLGWQPIYKSEYCALPTGYAIYDSWDDLDPFVIASGYQPAWLEYMTRLNELHGNFTGDLNYWTIGRSFMRRTSATSSMYEVDPSAYIFPSDYNTPFVDSSVAAENFNVQVAFDIFAKRPISKKLMPNLG